MRKTNSVLNVFKIEKTCVFEDKNGLVDMFNINPLFFSQRLAD